MTEPGFGPPGPMPFRLLLDEAMRQTRRHFRAIYPSVAIPVALLATSIGVAQALWFSRATESTGIPASPWSPEVILLTLVYLGVMIVAYNAMQVAAIDALSGRPVSMGRAWRFTAQARVLGTLFLWYAATLISFLCCCFPALYVGPLLSLVPPVMVDEGRFGTDALSRSAELTRHNPERKFLETPLVKIFLLLFVGGLLGYLVGLVVSLPFQIPMWVDMFRSISQGEDIVQRMPRWLWLQVPGQFFNALATTAVHLYVCFGIALLFFDARGRKEGSDLRSQIDSVFPGPPPSPGDRPF
jgi:uncharacterized membrane protein